MSALSTFRSVVRFRPPELNATRRRLRKVANIADLREIAKRRLPGGVFDYIDGGAEDEIALRRSVAAFDELTFRPRVLVDVSAIDTAVELFGTVMPLPLILGATGFTRIAASQGELAVARAAQRAGLVYTLGTLGTRSIEEVATVSSSRKWFQLYMWRDRGLVRDMLERARANGYEAVVLTVDTPVFGRRNRDVRRGFTLPPKIGFDTLLDGVVHPGWTLDFVRSGPITFENVRGASVGDGSTAVSLAEYVNSQFDATLTWSDVDWLRSTWPGPVVLKGIQDVADARRSADVGVDAIVLSNHGGRQVDSSVAIVDLVPPVVEALGGRIPVLCDGGIRRGSDIVKAVALGATACLVGRAYLFGLGAAGEAGVDLALGLLRDEVRRTLALIGCPAVRELSPAFVSACNA